MHMNKSASKQIFDSSKPKPIPSILGSSGVEEADHGDAAKSTHFFTLSLTLRCLISS
jgi:hypothetical protein